jgi:hypothetical protein
MIIEIKEIKITLPDPPRPQLRSQAWTERAAGDIIRQSLKEAGLAEPEAGA